MKEVFTLNQILGVTCLRLKEVRIKIRKKLIFNKKKNKKNEYKQFYFRFK